MQKLSKFWLGIPILIAFLVFFGPWNAGAATVGTEPPAAANGKLRVPPTPGLWQIGSSLIGVLLVGAAGVMLVARIKGITPASRGGPASDLMTLRQSVRLSPKHRVHAIEFGANVLLVGECDGNLTVLGSSADPAVRSDDLAVERREMGIANPGVDLRDTAMVEAPIHGNQPLATDALADFRSLLRQARSQASV